MKKAIALCCSVMLVTVLAIAGCSSKPVGDDSSMDPTEQNKKIDPDSIILKQFEDPKPGSEIAIIKTSMGEIKVMFFPDDAPKAVENFLTLAKEGYYNGQTFHRVLENAIIQGGDPTGTGSGGESIYGEFFEDEFSLNLWHFTGALAMANRATADTNGSQFFIVAGDTKLTEEYLQQMRDFGCPDKVVDKYAEVGGLAYLDGKHTVFGQVIEGMDVIMAISQAEKELNESTGELSTPKEPIVIESIRFEPVAA